MSNDQLAIGQQAPNFTLNDGTGAERSLSDFRGQNVIVYFYPAAFTPGCTTEACDFRDNLASLQASGYQVVGISPDPVAKLADFAADESLTFPLLSDEGAVVARRWGAWGEKTIGQNTAEPKTVIGLLRSTFVIDPAGVLTDAQYNVTAQGHVAALRTKLAV
jgi:thioredoxin-dependent peroxiredoxin